MALTEEPRAGVSLQAQPTAPYLDAVWGYAFRGSTRFHVPGHKGGAGADPGLRTALGATALMLDVPADIHGIDLGPSPTPYQRAEKLAAEAHGAARTWFLTNGASQGNHALTLAIAPLGASVVVQRNSHASVVDGLVLSGGVPTYVAPEYEDELGMAHGVTPESLERAIEKGGGAARPSSSSRRPTTGWPPTWRAARPCATRPACRLSSTRRGARTSASTPTCRPARSSSARMRCSPRRTRSSARSPSRRCCTWRRPAASIPSGSPAWSGSRAARLPRRC